MTDVGKANPQNTGPPDVSLMSAEITSITGTAATRPTAAMATFTTRRAPSGRVGSGLERAGAGGGGRVARTYWTGWVEVTRAANARGVLSAGRRGRP